MILYKLIHSNGITQIAGHIVYRNLNNKDVYECCLMSSHGHIISIKDLDDPIKKDEFINKHNND